MTDIAEGAPAGRQAARARRAPAEARNADSGFYLAMALVSALIVFAGFAPSFYLKSLIHAPPPLTALTVAHGVVFTGWMALFIAQAALIFLNKPAPHRQLGILGALLFGAMISLGASVAITAGRLGHTPPASPPPLAFMALPLFGIAAAAILVGAALWNRARSDWHKRLMLASVFVMTGPGTGRIAIPIGLAAQGVWLALGVAEVLLAICVVYDYSAHKRVHPAYVMAACVFAVFHLGVVWAFGADAWLAFARQITAA